MGPSSSQQIQMKGEASVFQQRSGNSAPENTFSALAFGNLMLSLMHAHAQAEHHRYKVIIRQGQCNEGTRMYPIKADMVHTVPLKTLILANSIVDHATEAH